MLGAIGDVVTVGASAILKKILDDTYKNVKDFGVNHFGLRRSDVKEDEIASALQTITKVKTLWNYEREGSLYDFYYPSRIIFPRSVPKKVSGLKDIGGKVNLVIQGTAGQGKSIFLRYLCGQELIDRFTTNRVPIFIELRRISVDMGVSALISEALRKYKLPHTSSAWEYLAGSGKFVLLMDAFDEIDPALSARTVAEIERIAEQYLGELQIIITSRPDADIQRSALFRVCRLAPLEDSDHLQFLEKICEDQLQAEALMQVLNGSSTDIRGLLTTPLMVTLLVILYKSVHAVPDTVPRFYEALFDVLFHRHDNSKPGFRRKRYTKLDDAKIKQLFSAFCFYIRLQSFGVLNHNQFNDCVQKAATACNEIVDSEKFKDELTKTLCLVQQDGFEYSLIHKSVAQYYSAYFVSSSSSGFVEKFYKLARNPELNWDLELKFLAQIDTYNYMKFYELPILQSVAHDLEYSFLTMNESAAKKLNDCMFEKVSLMFQYEEDGTAFCSGWSHTTVKEEPILTHLSSTWASYITRELDNNEEFANSVLEIVKTHNRFFDPGVDLRCLYIKNLIGKYVPDLPSRVLLDLQHRYENAKLVIEAEDAKISMLADFF